jgi:hypothetical protein
MGGDVPHYERVAAVCEDDQDCRCCLFSRPCRLGIAAMSSPPGRDRACRTAGHRGGSVVEIVVVDGCAGASALWRRGTLQELRSMTLARFARFTRRALSRVATDLGL